MCSVKFHLEIINLITITLLLISAVQTQITDVQSIRTVRRPNRFDHALCRQRHNGFGVRASAVLNRNGELCKTYCRVINRVNSTLSLAEYISPNNLVCGPRRARCIDGICQPFNFNGLSNGVVSDGSIRRRGRPRNPNPENNIGSEPKKRIRPGRRGTANRQKTTSLSTIEITELSETSTPDFVIKENPESDSTNAKIIFPND